METEADDNERLKLAREFSLFELAAKLSAMTSTIQLASLHAVVLIGADESRSPQTGYSYYTFVVCAFSFGGLLSIPVDFYFLPMLTNARVVHVLVMGVFTLAGEALFIESVQSTSSLNSSTTFILKIIGSRLLMGSNYNTSTAIDNDYNLFLRSGYGSVGSRTALLFVDSYVSNDQMLKVLRGLLRSIHRTRLWWGPFCLGLGITICICVYLFEFISILLFITCFLLLY